MLINEFSKKFSEGKSQDRGYEIPSGPVFLGEVKKRAIKT